MTIYNVFSEVFTLEGESLGDKHLHVVVLFKILSVVYLEIMVSLISAFME